MYLRRIQCRDWIWASSCLNSTQLHPYSSEGDGRNEFTRRIIPRVYLYTPLPTFPYHINEHTKDLLVEGAAFSLRYNKLASFSRPRLTSSSGRILLQSIPGTELCREEMVWALAQDLEVPVLVIAYDIDDEDNGESGEEGSLESEKKDDDEKILSGESESSDSSKSDDVSSSDKSGCQLTKVNDVENDLDAQSQDFFISVEAVCKHFEGLQGLLIVYFEDSSEWLHKLVPKSNQSEYLHKVEEMLNRLSGPVVFIQGQDKVQSGSNEKQQWWWPIWWKVWRLTWWKVWWWWR